LNILIEANKLRTNRFLKNEEEIINFEEAIENILYMQDIKHIEYLCSGFDDSTEDPEVMFGLIHAIESYDNVAGVEASLKELVKSIPGMMPHAKEWVLILHKRILNDPSSLKAYVSVIRGSNIDTKERIVNIMEDIKKDNPQKFKDNVEAFLNYL